MSIIRCGETCWSRGAVVITVRCEADARVIADGVVSGLGPADGGAGRQVSMVSTREAWCQLVSATSSDLPRAYPGSWCLECAEI